MKGDLEVVSFMPLSLNVGSALALWLRHGIVHATCNAEDYGSLQPTTMSPQLGSILAGVCISQPFIVVRLRNHAGSSRRFRISASADVRLKTRSILVKLKTSRATGSPGVRHRDGRTGSATSSLALCQANQALWLVRTARQSAEKS